jgi:hypothetical protein
MADIVVISPDNEYGAQYLEMFEHINQAIGIAHRLKGLRAQTIGVGDNAVTFATVFGVTQNPQALSDRLSAFESGTYTGLGDLVSAVYAELQAP